MSRRAGPVTSNGKPRDLATFSMSRNFLYCVLIDLIEE